MIRCLSRRLFAALGIIVLALSGCGGGVGKLYPVEGKVTVDGKPLPFGRLTFVPDKEKGNDSTATPFGEIKEGSYSLTTKGKTGAPAGWYNVMVLTQWPGAPPNPVELPIRYSDPGKSKLSVEVAPTPNAGQYDLKLEADRQQRPKGPPAPTSRQKAPTAQ